jgi:hypothetical protein
MACKSQPYQEVDEAVVKLLLEKGAKNYNNP